MKQTKLIDAIPSIKVPSDWHTPPASVSNPSYIPAISDHWNTAANSPSYTTPVANIPEPQSAYMRVGDQMVLVQGISQQEVLRA